MLWEQLNLTPPSPRRWNPDIDAELEQIVLQCLAIQPAERFGSALELLKALETALQAVAVTPPPAMTEASSASMVPPGQLTRDRQRSWRAPLTIGFIALAALLAGFVINSQLNSLIGHDAPAVPSAGAITETPPATFTATTTSTPSATATAR